MKLRKLLSFAIALCMVLSLFPVTAYASNDTAGVCGDNLSWTLDENGTLTISGTGPMWDYSNYYDEEIDDWVERETPWDKEAIVQIVVEPGVTTIGERAFLRSWCETVTLPEGLVSIGEDAFYNSRLRTVNFPSTLTTIGEAAFYSCYNLDGTLVIPASVTDIGRRAFSNVYALSAFQVAENNPAYASLDGVLFTKDMATLLFYPGDKPDTEYNVPDSVTAIERSSMCQLLHLEVLNIGSNVSYIGDYAMTANEALRQINVAAENPNYVSLEGTLVAREGMRLLIVPTAYPLVDNTLYIPNGVQVIAGEAMRMNPARKVVMSDTVTTLEGNAFTYLWNLREIDLANVQVVDSCAFQGLSSLTHLTYPASVTYIGWNQFTEQMNTILFEGDCPEISEGAYEYQENLTAYYPAGNATWTEDKLVGYGGNVTWVAYDPANPPDLTPAPTPNPGNADLTVWVRENEYEWMLYMAQLFGEIYGVSVAVEVGTPEDVLANPASAPDLYTYASDQLGQLVEAEVVVPLNVISQDVVDFQAAYSSTTAMDSVTDVNGNVYGAPYGANTWYMYYNKDIFTEEDVTSMEAMLEKGKVSFPINNAWYLAAFYFANGCTMYGEKGNDASAGIQFGGDWGIAVTNYLVDLVQHPNFVYDDNGSAYNGMVNGTVGAFFSGPWCYYGLHEALGNSLGAVQLPSVTIGGETNSMRAFMGTNAMGMHPRCSNLDLALEFLALAAGPEGQLIRWEMFGDVPISDATRHNFADGSMEAAIIDTVYNTAAVQPGLVPMYHYWNAMNQFGNEIISGAITHDNAAEKTQALNEALNNGGDYNPDPNPGIEPGSGQCGDNLYWTQDENGVLTITGEGPMWDFGYRENPETGDWEQFRPGWNKRALTDVIFESGCTYIGYEAFWDSTMTSLVLPETLVGIANFAFTTTMRMTGDIVIPAGVTEIGYRAFYMCNAENLIVEEGSANFSSLDGVLFNADQTSLLAYPGGKQADSYTVPESVRMIAGSAISNMYLEWLNIGSNVELIQEPTGMVTGCWALVGISVDEGNPNYADSDGMLTTKDKKTLLMVPSAGSGETLLIPQGIETIGQYACAANGAKTIVLADSVKTIESWAFMEAQMEQIDLANVVTIQPNAFACWSLSHVTFPATVEFIGRAVFGEWGLPVNSVTFEGDYPEIDENAFVTMENLTAYYPADNETWTADKLVGYGGNVNWVPVENEPAPCEHGTTEIRNASEPTCTAPGYTGDTYCVDCGELIASGEEIAALGHEYQAVVTEPTCTEQGYTTHTCARCGDSYVDSYMDAHGHDFVDGHCEICGEEDPDFVATSGTCGDNLTWTFNEETGTLTISGTGPMWDYEGYYDEEQDLFVPNPTPWIDLMYTSVVVEEGVTYIGKFAFCGSYVETATLADSITSIGNSAFEGTGLTEIELPENLVTLGHGVFAGSALTEIQLPDTLETIGDGTFNHCFSLTELTIPANVNSIGAYAFYACTGISEITFLGDAPAMADTTFGGVCATVKYPADNDTWTEDVLQNYGGALTWEPYGEVEIPTSGTCGGELTWTYDPETDTLTITGIGEMFDFIISTLDAAPGYTVNTEAAGEAPWARWSSEISTIVIGEGVTSIGDNAFRGCAVTEITIPASVSTIGEASFADCGSLTEVTFEGDAPEIQEGAFEDVVATVSYPADNDTWTEEVFENYGGEITWEAADDVLLGDVNGDGSVNNIDAMLILQYAVGLLTDADLNLEAADVNSDGSANNIDAMLVLQFAVGLLDRFN